MINNPKQFDENYQLILLTEQHIQTIFHWNIEEKHFEYYTCRPLKLCESFEEYASKTLKIISERKAIIYVLINGEDCNKPLGKITLFDINTRNHSAEFGYYLPNNNRGQGLGRIILSKFIQISFKDDELNLNKIYATTSSNNYPSIKLLEKYDFKLDGRLPEHYWINENKYDQLIYSILKQELIK
jgi:RimJ/RimL family protein N-acetyltransferase